VLIDADVRSATTYEDLYYVAISRSKSELRIYTDDIELLPERMSRSREKTVALSVKKEAEKSLNNICL
jgi:hypothetical protein